MPRDFFSQAPLMKTEIKKNMNHLSAIDEVNLQYPYFGSARRRLHTSLTSWKYLTPQTQNAGVLKILQVQ